MLRNQCQSLIRLQANLFKVNTVRISSLNGSSDPFIAVHMEGEEVVLFCRVNELWFTDIPTNAPYNIRVKLKSKSKNSGYRYIVPTVAVPAIKVPQTRNTTRLKNVINFNERELAGYLGRVRNLGDMYLCE